MKTGLRLVRVDWFDARSLESGWKSLEKAKAMELEQCVSVGFVVNENKLSITLVSSLTEKEGLCDGEVIIPKGWVATIQELKHREQGSN